MNGNVLFLQPLEIKTRMDGWMERQDINIHKYINVKVFPNT